MMSWAKLVVLVLVLSVGSGVQAHPGHEGKATPRRWFGDASNPSFRALVSSDVGLHVSTDQGASWRWICEDMFEGDVQTFALAGPGADPSTRAWLVGNFGREYPERTALPGLWRSTDAGCSWETTEGVLAKRWVRALSTNPADPSEVLAASADLAGDNGVARSTDAGATWAWTGLRGQVGQFESLLRAPSNPKVVYAAYRRGVWRSEDGGQRWTSILGSLLAGPIDELRLYAVDPEKPKVLYFSHFGVKGRTLYRSQDGGETFASILQPSQLDFADMALHATEGGGRRLVVGLVQRSVYQSEDEGKTWAEVKVPLAVRYVEADPAGGGAVMATRPRRRDAEDPWAGYAMGTWDGQEMKPSFTYAKTRGLQVCPSDSRLKAVCPTLDWKAISAGHDVPRQPGKGMMMTPSRPAALPEAVLPSPSDPSTDEESAVEVSPDVEEGAPSGWRWLWLLVLAGVVGAALAGWKRKESYTKSTR